MKKQFEECKKGRPGLPEVLCCVFGDLDSEDIVVTVRGMTCQAVQYHRNTAARDAAASGNMKDFKTGML